MGCARSETPREMSCEVALLSGSARWLPPGWQSGERSGSGESCCATSGEGHFPNRYLQDAASGLHLHAARKRRATSESLGPESRLKNRLPCFPRAAVRLPTMVRQVVSRFGRCAAFLWRPPSPADTNSVVQRIERKRVGTKHSVEFLGANIRPRFLCEPKLYRSV